MTSVLSISVPITRMACLLQGDVQIVATYTPWTNLVSQKLPIHYRRFSLQGLIHHRFVACDWNSEHLYVKENTLRPRYMRIDDAVHLIECLKQGAVRSDDSHHTMMSFEGVGMTSFISSYTKPSVGSAKTSFCDTLNILDMQIGGRRLLANRILKLQYHFVCLDHVPKKSHKIYESPDEHCPEFLLERHSAKIRRISHAPTTAATGAGRTSLWNSKDGPSEDYFTEYRFSTSLNLYGSGGEFRLVLVGDTRERDIYGRQLDFVQLNGHSSLRFDRNCLGHLAGLTHFLIAVAHFMDHWSDAWERTLKKIDDIVGFEVSMAHGSPQFKCRER